MRQLWLIALVALTVPAPAAESAPVPERASQFFIGPGEPARLAWQGEAPPAAEDRPYALYDYAGALVQKVPLPGGGGRLEVSLTAPRGYYELELPVGGSRFGLLALEPWSAELPADSFFAIDSAMSWLVADPVRRNELIDVLHRSGIRMSRERLSWSQIRPAADAWQWETDRGYDTLRRAYAARGVTLLEMFHDAPRWLGSVGKYPGDLVAAARDWRQIADRWQALWGGLEIWNEPDIFFGANLPADQYVAVVRAVAWGLHRQADALPVVGGVFAHDHPEFLENAALNGLLELIDVASFHTYGRAGEMEQLVGRYRRWLQQHERGGLPLWITECGRPWRRGPDRPPADQDAQSALDIVMKAVEARACGVQRYFAFVYPFYEENDWNFGLTARDGTPLRSMAAYAQLVRVLGHKRYIGDLQVAGEAVQRARVFADEGATVAVLYTGSPGEARTVQLAPAALRIEGIDGRELAAADGQIPVADGLVYVWLAPGGLDRHLLRETTAAGLRPAGRSAAAVAPSPLVLRYEFDPQVVEAHSHGYRLKQTGAQRLKLAVRAFNLSAAPQAVQLDIRTAGAGPAADTGGDPAAGRQLTIAAESNADLEWEVDVGPGIAAAGRSRVTITARGAGDSGTVPLVLDFLGEASLEQVLQRWPREQRIEASELAAWTPNVVGHGRLELARSPAGQWRMDAVFGAGDRWAYPTLRLPADLDLGRWSGLVLRARCRQPATVRVMLREPGDVIYLTPQTIIPADDQWHVAEVRFASLTLSGANAPDPNGRLDLDQVRGLSAGINSDAAENRLEISDLFLVGE